jgi:Dolichyl-phosphate-mannose-protein mannosyltransferase
VSSNSDPFPLSSPTLRTVGPPQFADSGSEQKPQQQSFLRNPKAAGRLLFLMVFLLSALYAAKDLKRGWIPSDEGTFGQSAERVLQGELPHRDFVEGYTGGLTYLHALAFRVQGTNLASLRYVLYLFFLAWVPAIYLAAVRFVSSPVASAVTFLAVAWSIPNYSAPMPSWYNLFFATFGLVSILRYIETGNRRWLFIAGLCGGLSFLFKQTGLYFVAGVLLFLVFREQVASGNRSSRTETVLYRIFLVASLILYEALLVNLLRRGHLTETFLYFLLPNLAIGAAIVWNEFFLVEARSRRFVFLFREFAPFAAGVALPVLVLLVPYFLTGTMFQFVHDVFVLPGLRFTYTLKVWPWVGHTMTMMAIAANLLLIAAVFFAGTRTRTALGLLALIGTPVILLIARVKDIIYKSVWHTIWILVPIVIVLGVVLVPWRLMRRKMDAIRQQQIFLVLCVAATCNLIQFPCTVPIYLCYVVPLVILAVTAMIGQLEEPPRLLVAAVFCFYLLYVMLEVTPGWQFPMGLRYLPEAQITKLTLPRAGGLRVDPESARTYEELGVLLSQHGSGKYIYATPDCPEVYFLYGFRNPTRTFYDFNDEPTGRTPRILSTIAEHDIRLVVLKRHPDAWDFSGPIPTELQAALEGEFPYHATTGKFEVRWKPPNGKQ